MVVEHLWTLHGCKPAPPSEEEKGLEAQRVVCSHALSLELWGSHGLIQASAINPGLVAMHPLGDYAERMHPCRIQTTAKAERKRKAAETRAAKQAAAAQQAGVLSPIMPTNLQPGGAAAAAGETQQPPRLPVCDVPISPRHEASQCR